VQDDLYPSQCNNFYNTRGHCHQNRLLECVRHSRPCESFHMAYPLATTKSVHSTSTNATTKLPKTCLHRSTNQSSSSRLRCHVRRGELLLRAAKCLRPCPCHNHEVVHVAELSAKLVPIRSHCQRADLAVEPSAKLLPTRVSATRPVEIPFGFLAIAMEVSASLRSRNSR
jgi:hypothetical protein